jgi:hypothetical protein
MKTMSQTEAEGKHDDSILNSDEINEKAMNKMDFKKRYIDK